MLLKNAKPDNCPELYEMTPVLVTNQTWQHIVAIVLHACVNVVAADWSRLRSLTKKWL
jgi:hypothetical protein